MKKFGILLAVIVIVSVGLVALGGKDKDKGGNVVAEQSENSKQADAKPETTVAETTTEETTSAEAPTAKLEEHTSVSADTIASLSNESLPWGSGGECDENNVPGGCIAYQEQYGKYDGDFVRTDENKDKIIYLTMDEGYENGYTPTILDTLKEKGVKCVFFVTYDYATSEPDLVKRMIDEGHIVGNHSVTHPSAGMPSLSLDDQKVEVMKLHEYIKEKYNYEMKLFRYPAGIFSEQSLAQLQSLGYRGVFWSFAHADWDPNNQPDEASALQNCLDSLHPGAIYLLHAVSKTNTDNMAAFIDGAREAGYTFESYY